MMGFLGNIGSMMKGSGLEVVPAETVYGYNAVTHNPTCMTSVKAVSWTFQHSERALSSCFHII